MDEVFLQTPDVVTAVPLTFIRFRRARTQEMVQLQMPPRRLELA